jgi:hypothetical protein
VKTEVLAFIQDIPANSSALFKERLKDNGQVMEIRIRFYPGVEKALQIHPYLLHTNNRAEEILTYSGGDKIITGDDDYFVFPVNLDFQLDDEFAVSVVNTNTVYPYTMCVFVVVNYMYEA